MPMTEGSVPVDARLRDRYAWRDPARHEWTAGDIAFGWAVGIGVVLAGSLVLGVVMAGAGAVIVVIVGALIGIPVHTLYGVPVAIAAATALRRTESELVHLAVFALLGAVGGAVTGLLLAEPIGVGWAVMAPAVIAGTTTAVASRALAHDRALRSRGARSTASTTPADAEHSVSPANPPT